MNDWNQAKIIITECSQP